jgi:hypothetical protein
MRGSATICSNTCTRSELFRSLESRMPRGFTSSGIRQAAATMGPAAEPTPLSSMPAPHQQRGLYLSILHNGMSNETGRQV